ncbi:hypothetical protein SKAU_G00104750 [Synaphobranchus kaupii]|uniref:Uncharacterized protein n=1 Tax=Synaphobranchus kaupii TaxID=118154 RepID=A0A9Q1FZX4_SYNKA|nr:hypothetical protein SKAU_G00104750 [Synaphobranchus kaupii]
MSDARRVKSADPRDDLRASGAVYLPPSLGHKPATRNTTAPLPMPRPFLFSLAVEEMVAEQGPWVHDTE